VDGPVKLHPPCLIFLVHETVYEPPTFRDGCIARLCVFARLLRKNELTSLCFFILRTAALRPWHIYNGIPPPGRGQLVRPPRSPPTKQNQKQIQKQKERENCSPGLDSAPLPWDRRLTTPVPALPALSKAPSPTFHPSYHSFHGSELTSRPPVRMFIGASDDLCRE
jgi:hypothetical protein